MYVILTYHKLYCVYNPSSSFLKSLPRTWSTAHEPMLRFFHRVVELHDSIKMVVEVSAAARKVRTVIIDTERIVTGRIDTGRILICYD